MPPPALVFDVETFASVDLGDVGADVMSAHPDTDCLCAAWVEVEPDGTPCGDPAGWRPGHPPPAWAADPDRDVWAWNVAFDRLIYDRVLVPRYGWPPRPAARWRCLMARAAYAGLPLGLDKAAAVLATGEAKDSAGHRLMMRLARPARPTVRSDDPRRHHDPAALDRLVEYCRQDVRAEAAAMRRLPRLPADEEAAFALDRVINARGVAVDLGLVDACRRAIAGLDDALSAELAAATGGAVPRATMLAELAQWLVARGVPVPLKANGKPAKGGMDKAAVTGYLAALAGRTDPDAVAARRVLRLRQALGKTSLAKFAKLEGAVGADGRLRGAFQFYGAQQTGRWAGRLVQVQNLPKGLLGSKPEDGPTYAMARDLVRQFADDPGLLCALYGDGTDEPGPDGSTPPGLPAVLASLIRCCFVAAPGKVLLPTDYAAVEARGVLWLADDTKGLAAFRDGADIYRIAAAAILGIADPATVPRADRNKLGKPTVLGCGYGMGPDKFAATFHLPVEVGQRAVAAYRATFPAVPRLWKAVERAAITACRDPGRTVPCAGGRLAYHHDGRHLWCRLPSGRALVYRDARLVEGRFAGSTAIEYAYEDQLTHRWVRGTTWGGTLVENATQALCRDLLRDAMARLEARGFPVVLHVHDEAIPEVDDPGTPEGRAALVHEVERIMAEVPAWAAGFPCGAEGFATTYWRK